MRIVVTHLARARAGYVVVAGVDVETHAFVRPTVWERPLGLRDVEPNGGPFELGAIVDLGDVRPTPQRPALEDCQYEPWRVVESGGLDGPEYWKLLRRLARPKLRGIFGGPLRACGNGGAAIEEGAGIAALGCLAPRGRPRLFVVTRPDGSRVPRLLLGDGELEVFASATDLRLFRDDGETLDSAAVSNAVARLAAGERVLLSVGLSRAFSRGLGDPPAHWLVVSNLHFESRPGWRVADTWRSADQAVSVQAV